MDNGHVVRTPGELFWEPIERLGRYRLCVYRLCVYRLRWKESTVMQELPTGWSVGKEDRPDDQWAVSQFGESKTVVGTLEEAKAVALATYLLQGN